MIEKVNPSHPDKVADRIAGAIVDLAFTAADTLFRASCTAPTVMTSSEESTGTTVGASPQFGDVSAG